MLIAVEMEQKFSKQQILEFYANRVDLGSADRSPSQGWRKARILISTKT